jgi:Holliday junction resolvase-like predicted endonuclease
MSNYLTGHSAEVRAAEYLKNLGFKVKELNWKTKYCEIDIIAEKDKAIYFIEVKYRRNNKQGFGLDYVTPKKLRQMRFAAEMWVGNSGWAGEYQLAAVGMDGDAVTFVDEL